MQKFYVIPSQDDKQELERIAHALDGYWKTLSILTLRRAGIPTLDGMIVTGWDEETSREVKKAAQARNWSGFLLRHDKKPEQPPYPTGGYIADLTELDQDVGWFLDQGRIVILLEPWSPLENSYNVSALFESPEHAVLEIVGPGFDASDLQRGHLSPHETIEIKFLRRPYGRSLSKAAEIVARRHIDIREYQTSVRNRLAKIYRKFVLGDKTMTSRDVVLDDISEKSTRKFLIEKGKTRLLDREQKYVPIPDAKLDAVLSFLTLLPSRVAKHFPLEYPFVVAASFVGKRDKLVFWDIVIPSLKFNR